MAKLPYQLTEVIVYIHTISRYGRNEKINTSLHTVLVALVQRRGEGGWGVVWGSSLAQFRLRRGLQVTLALRASGDPRKRTQRASAREVTPWIPSPSSKTPFGCGPARDGQERSLALAVSSLTARFITSLPGRDVRLPLSYVMSEAAPVRLRRAFRFTHHSAPVTSTR